MEQMAIVQHQEERVGVFNGGGHRRQDPLFHRGGAQLQQVQDSGVEGRHPSERQCEVREQHDRVVVGLVELEPRARPRVCDQPLGERDALTVASGCGDEGEGTPLPEE